MSQIKNDPDNVIPIYAVVGFTFRNEQIEIVEEDGIGNETPFDLSDYTLEIFIKKEWDKKANIIKLDEAGGDINITGTNNNIVEIKFSKDKMDVQIGEYTYWCEATHDNSGENIPLFKGPFYAEKPGAK